LGSKRDGFEEAEAEAATVTVSKGGMNKGFSQRMPEEVKRMNERMLRSRVTGKRKTSLNNFGGELALEERKLQDRNVERTIYTQSGEYTDGLPLCP
jgi:hypothetical protein